LSVSREIAKFIAAEGTRLVKGGSAVVRQAEKEVGAGLGRDGIRLGEYVLGVGNREAQKAAEHTRLVESLERFGLRYDDATVEWLAGRKMGGVLSALEGFKVDREGFKDLARTVESDLEVKRIGTIADFVRKHPWMNPDLTTVQGFRSALATNRVPAFHELSKAAHEVDVRMVRDYKLAPDWVDNAHEWRFLHMNGSAGDEGASYWLADKANNLWMAKVPPDSRRGVNERVGYSIHTTLGLPVNEVRYGQRDWVALLTLHKEVQGQSTALDRVAHDIGLDSSDFRIGPWPYPTENIGTGPSTWNRQKAQEYMDRIGGKLEDPTIFDKLSFVGRVNDDPDLKPGNMLATYVVNGENKAVWRITRIDFGIMHDGWQLRNLNEDLAIFEAYLDTLTSDINKVHLKNILPTMKQFASLGDADLTTALTGNITRNADGSAAEHMPANFLWQMSRRYTVKRDMVRAWLEQNRALIEKLGS
jgi:hypothetical protein